MAIDLSPSIDQQGVFSISVYSTAPTADSPDSREEFRLSLPSNELMPAETKAQTATVAAAAVKDPVSTAVEAAPSKASAVVGGGTLTLTQAAGAC